MRSESDKEEKAVAVDGCCYCWTTLGPVAPGPRIVEFFLYVRVIVCGAGCLKW